MTTRAIGLDIGTTGVRAVQLALGGSRGPATLEKIGQVVLPPGAVRDGELVQPDIVAAALKELWQRFSFTGRKVVLGVSNQQVVVRQLDVPYQPAAQLKANLATQVQDHIPINVADAVLDHQVLHEWQTPDGQPMLRLLVVAAVRGMVDSRLEVLKLAKLEPERLDLDAFAMLRSLASSVTPLAGNVPVTTPADEDEDEGEVVVVIGGGITNLVVQSGGVPRFVRILLLAGSAITESLQTVLGMSYAQAEAAKAAPDYHGGEVPRIVAERTNRFVEEIRGSLDYYRAQPDSVRVSRMVVSGGGSLLTGLPERLGDATRLHVERGHPLQSLKIGRTGLAPEQLAEAESYLAVAVGLALGGGT